MKGEVQLRSHRQSSNSHSCCLVPFEFIACMCLRWFVVFPRTELKCMRVAIENAKLKLVTIMSKLF